jgi:magnesium chelatase family protein
MLAKVKSAAVVGLEGAVVEVEVDLSPGLPSFTKKEFGFLLLLQ